MSKLEAHNNSINYQQYLQELRVLMFFLLPQADFSHGAAQEVRASIQKCPGVQKPSEDAGSQGGHQTRVHRAEAECGTAGEQENEGGEKLV